MNLRYNISFQRMPEFLQFRIIVYSKSLEFSGTGGGKTGKILSATFNVNSEVKFGSKTANESQTEEQYGNANSVRRFLFVQLWLTGETKALKLV